MSFTLRLTSTATQERLWSVVTDVARHGDHVPATTVRTDAGRPRVGWGFTARTGIGPVRVDDAMVLSVWDPPHRMRAVKVGRVLGGWAEATVDAAEGGGSVLTWRASVVPRGLPRFLGGAADAVAASAYERALRSLVATAEDGGP